MICPKCGGRDFRVKSGRYTKDGSYVRKRVCLDCKFVKQSVEIPLETYERNSRFVSSFLDLFKDFFDLE